MWYKPPYHVGNIDEGWPVTHWPVFNHEFDTDGFLNFHLRINANEFYLLNSAIFLGAERLFDTALYGATLDAWIRNTQTTMTINTLPVGTILLWPNAQPPSGYLLCDGSAFSAAQYPQLAAIVNNFNIPNIGDEYYLPDLRGRFAFGAIDDARPPDPPIPLGARGGSRMHTLTVSEIPSHNHGLEVADDSNARGSRLARTNSSTGIATFSSTNVGGGSPHNNMPPYVAVNFIIKAVP